MSTTVAFVLKGYPRLSETFIAQEILALERRGLELVIVSLRRPTDPHRHPMHAEIRARVTYLPEYLLREPVRVWRGWRAARRRPGYRDAFVAWMRDLRRDPSPNRMRRYGQALVLARELPEDVGWIHAHFLHTPASVARYAAAILGLPWSCSAHAKDIWTTPEWEKREKLAACRWLVACTRFGVEHLRGLTNGGERVELVYHGIDHSRFPAPACPRPPRNGRDPEDPVTILSVGRAVEKKGYPGLLDALRRLPGDLNWRLVHVGGGRHLPALRRQARRSGIGDRIEWLGGQPHEVVLEQYRRADLFALNCRIAADGDRDGLPNVLLEAQSQGLACLATRVSGIPELIDDGETGVLVPADEPEALARALQSLLTDPLLRARLGRAGLERVRRAFSFEAGIDRLAARFGLAGERDSG